MISWTWYGRVWNDNISDNGLTAPESQVGGGGMGSIMFARERVYATGMWERYACPRSQPEARQLPRCEAIDAVGLRLEADQSS